MGIGDQNSLSFFSIRDSGFLILLSTPILAIAFTQPEAYDESKSLQAGSAMRSNFFLSYAIAQSYAIVQSG
ncbi:hypothetical protein [Leptodesmis sichuanensis]|uniref:hypothetical protein n=1 Tax=Leptodesmis sichuanensis TaxID=2906798 RepID=UPI001F3F99B2|nr:hypothetical protein [Leptodesmis sichuanensis]UIE40020.1 hypothetical protein KIK02_11015 [Leptodesmis sichuanensis A121]